MLLSTLVLAALCVLITSASAQKLRVVACEGSVAQLKCDKDEVISVTSAAYGRRDQKTCAAGRPANQIVNVRCSRSFGINPFNILPKPLHLHKHFRKLVPIFDRQGKGSSSNKVAESCNGKQSCSITAANSVFGDPCVRTYKYLEVDYTCENPEGKPESGPTVACEGSVAQLKCDGGKVISVTGATYGRRDQKTCAAGRPADQIANIQCPQSFGIKPSFRVIKPFHSYKTIEDIVHLLFHQGKGSSSNKVAESCNGKQSCSITAANSVFGDPCVRTYKYLEVDYTCENPEGKPESGPTVACEGSVAQLKCGKGELIYVTGATYGRRDQKTCAAGRPADQIANVRCSSGNSDRVGQSCNGKQSCSITAANSVFGDPCVGTYKYLEVDYICYACLTG
ncbi:uncharacterized protein LOC129356249 [Poeciliopsis prolifica]|uniref:uncharacterized protein LOC129356249 n=1 Tax=Poeciliopsis prolifica TaxID=188132 RepID=UPI0024142B09|nr:uncharacterized protein LOC129356249 [Poeciliopsis prolifica]